MSHGLLIWRPLTITYKYTTRKSSHTLFIHFPAYFCILDSSPFPSSVPHAFQINFNSLYTTLCEQQTSDQATLLLYTLLHQNSNVRTYMLARTDMENLVSITRNMPCVSCDITKSDLFSFPRGQECSPDGRCHQYSQRVCTLSTLKEAVSSEPLTAELSEQC